MGGLTQKNLARWCWVVAAYIHTKSAVNLANRNNEHDRIIEMSSSHVWRPRLFHILHKPSPANPAARRVNYLLAFLIVANAIAVALESVKPLGSDYRQFFLAFEGLSTAIFAIEYLTRLWVCVEQEHLSRPVLGRVRYALQPLPILDLIVVVTFFTPIDLRFLRVARLIRLLKVFHLDEFDEAFGRITESLRRRRSLLVVAVTLMAASIYVSASILYQVEHRAQPEIFTSIPATFWWAVETLTTIGYGDMTPKTTLGKICTGLISIFGIGVFALPTAVVTAAIIEAGASK
jgi:voltage-gated potassium channel